MDGSTGEDYSVGNASDDRTTNDEPFSSIYGYEVEFNTLVSAT